MKGLPDQFQDPDHGDAFASQGASPKPLSSSPLNTAIAQCSCFVQPMGMTNQADLTRLALRALEEAVAEARYGVVERKWGHRLALTWLRRAGVAQTWQAKDFWQRLADQPDEHRG